MKDFNLSPNFTFYELTGSANYPQYVLQNRQEAERFILPLTELAVTILQPIRDHFGRTYVDSGYRSFILNQAVGSKTNKSQHRFGEAADIKVPGVQPVNVWDWIKLSGIPFGQLILERTWVHISLGVPYRPAKKCGQVLIIL